MNNEGKKRPPRTPLTPEEVADFILLKKLREHKKLEKFKRSKEYKFLNIFNVICFFIYIELICCIFGPCHYQGHYSKNIFIEYGEKITNNKRIIAGLKVVGINDKQYNFAVHDFIKTPEKFSFFEIGKDYILQKEVKGSVSTSNETYRTQNASPIFFLSVFVGIFSCIFFFFDLNQNPYSLWALTSINAITVFGFMAM